jgi:hypothetical protein
VRPLPRHCFRPRLLQLFAAYSWAARRCRRPPVPQSLLGVRRLQTRACWCRLSQVIAPHTLYFFTSSLFPSICSQLHFQVQRRRLSLQRMSRSVLRPAVLTVQRSPPPLPPPPTFLRTVSMLIAPRISDPLVGSYITAGASKMHLRCFTCHACSRAICDTDSTSPYYEKDGNFYCRKDYIRLFMPVCAVRISPLLPPPPPPPPPSPPLHVTRVQVCCASVSSKYACNDWGQVMCSSHSPESSQCFDCGRYMTSAVDPPKRHNLLRFLSSSAREALFSDVAHSSSPIPSASLSAAISHVTSIVDPGRTVDGRSQVIQT